MTFSRRDILISAAGISASACAPRIREVQDADVLIIGAGLSGLHAARMLNAEGFKVAILEASTRIGGRMWSLTDLPGAPEAGGRQVGQSYARIRSSASDLGLEFEPPMPRGGKTIIAQNEIIDAREWATSAANPFPETLRELTPDTVLLRMAAKNNPLADQYAWREAADHLDISARSFLQDAGLSEEAIDLCEISLNANELSSYSMLNAWRSLVLYEIDRQAGRSENIVGGSQRLPEAMASTLPEGSIHLGVRAEAVSVERSGVEVRTKNKAWRAPYCVCSVPFATLRNIPVTMPGDGRLDMLINEMPYTQIIQIHLSLDGLPNDDLPLRMWTDTPIERVFPTFDRSCEPVGLYCWIKGVGASMALSDEVWFELAESTLLQRRGIRATGRKVVRWDESNGLSGGAYMHWAPGQISKWGALASEPRGGLYFAGEHTSYLHTGMEGAMESGERAAISIMEKSATE